MLLIITTYLCFIPLIFAFLSLIYVLNFAHKNPCPQSYPIIGNLVAFVRNRHRFHDWVADLLSTSPSLSIQVNGFLGVSTIVCTANPANVQRLLRSNFHNYVKGTRFQTVFTELLGNGIFNVDAELWSMQRKISSHEFNTKSLKHFISDTVLSQISTHLIPYLSTVCTNQEVIDLQDVFCRFTFGNICNVAFGIDPAWTLDSKHEDQSSLSLTFVHAFDYATEICSNRVLNPLPMAWKIKRLLNIGSEKKYKEAIRVINDYALNIISSKERMCRNEDEMEQARSQDLLSRFMYSSSKLEFRDGDEKRRFLRDIVISFILAGKDSTSTALTWFFWLIAGHPECACLIHDELLAASPGIFTYDKLKELNYLHAAISESLRLFPPIAINSRLTMSEDVLSDGTYVGKGWFADYSSYAMARTDRVWGPDCRNFKPERWLDENGTFQPCDQFKFPVFHCGPRMCLGKDMAYVQMKSIAAAILSEFEVVPIDGGGHPGRLANPPYSLSFLLKMKGGLPARLKRR